MRSRAFGAFLLVGAICALLISGFLALRTPGDVSIRSECRGSSLDLYRDPQPEGQVLPETDLDVAALCNDEARRGVEAAMFYLVGSGVGLVWSAWVLTRGREGGGGRVLGGAIAVLVLATVVVLVLYDSR